MLKLKPNLLFPRYFKIIGIALVVPGLVLSYLYEVDRYVIPFLGYGRNVRRNIMDWVGSYNLTDELATTLLVMGLLFIGFSQLKTERDSTQKLRLNALYWAVIADCLWILFVFIVTIIGEFLKFQLFKEYAFEIPVIIYNCPFLLILFISRFYYLLRRSQKGTKYNSAYLIPHSPYQIIGKIISVLVISILISLFLLSKLIEPEDYYSYLALPLPVSLLLWIWSMEKNELGLIKKIRLKSMHLAIYLNSGLYLASIWIFYHEDYLLMLNISLISIQTIFLIIFYCHLYKLKGQHRAKIISNI